jgi:quinol monooxygenase YgiN
MTRWTFALLAVFACASCNQTQIVSSAPADPQNVYVVSHIDVTPNFAAATSQLLKQYRADSTGEPGFVRMEAMVQDGRANHFTLVEVWSNRPAFEAHTAQPHTKDFRDKLAAYLGSPYDERLHGLL